MSGADKLRQQLRAFGTAAVGGDAVTRRDSAARMILAVRDWLMSLERAEPADKDAVWLLQELFEGLAELDRGVVADLLKREVNAVGCPARYAKQRIDHAVVASVDFLKEHDGVGKTQACRTLGGLLERSGEYVKSIYDNRVSRQAADELTLTAAIRSEAEFDEAVRLLKKHLPPGRKPSKRR